MNSLLCSAIVTLTASAAVAGSIVYVDDDALPGGDGTSWATAFRFLQDGLAFAAVPEHGVAEVRVAQGVYKPDRSEVSPGGTGDRTATFQLINGVAIRGGYLGLSAAPREEPNTRNVLVFISKLSGDLASNDQPGFVNYTENSLHVVNANMSSSTAILDGVTIASGNASGPGSFSLNGRGGGAQIIHGDAQFISCTFRDIRGLDGGAIYIEVADPLFDGCVFENNSGEWGGAISNEGSPTITGCEFRSNVVVRGGGAIYSEALRAAECAPVIEHCLFTANVSLHTNPNIFDGGGAIFNSHNVVAEIRNCDFSSNSAGRGGAIRNCGSFPGPDVNIEHCTFTNNTVLVGAFFGVGGAVAADFGNAFIKDSVFHRNSNAHFGGAHFGNAQFERCEFVGNSAGEGGAVSGGVLRTCLLEANHAFGNGGAAYLSVIEDCEFRFNSAGLGGAIVGGGQLPCVRTLFLGNSAVRGGAVWMLGDEGAFFHDCKFLSNSAQESGGAIENDDTGITVRNCEFVGNTAVTAGGAVATGLGFSELINCTFFNNAAGSIGGAVSGWSSVKNSTCWWNIPDQVEYFDSKMEVHHSNIQGGWRGPGPGNIDAMPLFIDADGVDNILGTLDDNLRLRPGSPCIDAADNGSVPAGVTTDLGGHPRFIDDPSTPDTGNGSAPIVDMGAYEFNPACIADVHPTPDGDGAINIGDLLFIIQYWGATGPHSADVTFDGTVGIADLLGVIAAWGDCA